jgi:predicted metal-binding membrane protein
MPESSISALAEALARRERAAVLAALGLTIAPAWAWLLTRSGPAMMPGMANDFPVVLTMWAAMMAAMMLPGAAPAILLLAGLSRMRTSLAAIPAAAVFAAGYLAVWALFSAGAAAAQRGMGRAMLLSADLRTTTGAAAALLLLAAGFYQLTPAKAACLRHCRSPVEFFTRHWRPGAAGLIRLGVLHGAYCVGCCWALMGLLFVGGMMNPWWIAAVAAFILAEKTVFVGRPAGRVVSGAALMLAGAAALAST